MMSDSDRLAIYECIALHGHLVDDGRLDDLHLVFTEDFEHDLSAFGLGLQRGLTSIKKVALELGEKNPIGHHVTNSVVTKFENEVAYAISKGLGINTDGTANSVVYEDELVKQENGWRIRRRKIVMHAQPLSGVYDVSKKPNR